MRSWPHAPSRLVVQPGTYIITASTYQKAHLFRGQLRLTLLNDIVLKWAEEMGWRPEAWAIFSNHYHVIGHSPDSGDPAVQLTRRIHGEAARLLNELDGTPGRRVFYRSWPTLITEEKPFLARLAYVHNNPVRHGLVAIPSNYPYCSASWFEERSEGAFYKTVMSFKTDRVSVVDDFEVDASYNEP